MTVVLNTSRTIISANLTSKYYSILFDAACPQICALYFGLSETNTFLIHCHSKLITKAADLEISFCDFCSAYYFTTRDKVTAKLANREVTGLERSRINDLHVRLTHFWICKLRKTYWFSIVGWGTQTPNLPLFTPLLINSPSECRTNKYGDPVAWWVTGNFAVLRFWMNINITDLHLWLTEFPFT